MSARPSTSRVRPAQVSARAANGPGSFTWLKSPAAAPAWVRVLLVAIGALFLLYVFSPAVGDTDTWWHLKTGEYMWQHHRLPVPDPFSFTTYMGKPVYPGEEVTRYFNLTHEWLAQVFLYGSYAAGGFRGLVLMRAFALTLFCGLGGWIVYRRTRSFYRALLAALAPWMVVTRFNGDRPQYFTYVLLAVTILILDGTPGLWRRSGTEAGGPWGQEKRLWLLPPLFFFWANCHGGFFMGWVVIGAYCGEDLYLRWRSGKIGKLSTLWLAGPLAILVSGLNPNYYRVLEVMRNYRLSPLQNQIWEWRKPIYWEVTPFTVLLFAGLAVLLWRWRQARPADWLLLAAFGGASLMAYRNIILGSLIGVVLVATYLPEWSPKAGWKEWLLPALGVIPAAKAMYPQMPIWYTLALAVCAFLIWRGRGVRVAEGAILVLFATGCTISIMNGGGFQFEADDWRVPAATADFLVQHHIKGRIFNTYGQGGYLIWRLCPEQQVFMDGRALNESVYDDSRRITMNAEGINGKSGEELLKEYKIDVIVMDAFDAVSGSAYYLPAALADPSQKEWKLVYRDVHDVIYMRNPPADIRVLDSFNALAGMEEQCTFYVEHGEPACASGLVDVFVRVGDRVRARKWAELFREMHYKPTFTVVQ